ncbi:MAG TPA: class I SAM-dependent RNA methyltransferase [Syntrophales bacterium]|mgnify:CR=1 FL=1|nr:class I SAM-dependent RNA methyltransferase [Syntrophales bacterium]HPQ45119.1 class I SAM-dependent RNA methyltransferase [Syntrophales bacterium]
MSLFTQKSSILITCAKGITPFLKEEILALGFPVQSEHIAGVETEGTLEDTIRLNLSIRTGQRVLYLIKRFIARSPDDLYKKMVAIPWEDYFLKNGYICITSSVDNASVKDTRFANLKGKDAIVDRFYQKFNSRPSSGPKRDKSVVFIYWKKDRGSIYIDTSGESLSRRGYRKIPLAAPMQETLAAAVVLASRWKGEEHFINPMCGSGTLAIEAALIAMGKDPGSMRNNYGFMHINGFSKPHWRKIKGLAEATQRKPPGKIIATDIDPKAIEAARRNAAAAGVDHLIEFGVCDFSDTPIPEGAGVVMLNPEYGERMGKIKELEEVYKKIGDFFKQRCTGYRGYIFTGNLELAKQVGLRAKTRIPFYNSNIECRLFGYDLYSGSKKFKA